jgi:hypothetical protein
MDGLNNKIYNNYFANSAAGCFLQKHNPRAGNQSFVYSNTFVNCSRHGANLEGTGYNIHHNLFINSTLSWDYAGADHNVFEYNTIYSSSTVLIPGNGEPNTFRRNILYQTATAFTVTDGLVTMRLSHWGTDSRFSTARSGDVFDYNCYFNPNLAIRISYYGGNNDQGGVYTLAQFKAIGKDTNSLEANPGFLNIAGNDFHTAAVSPCADRGVYAIGSPANPPLTPAAALGRNP